MRAPAGYVPQEIKARPEKTWQQGLAADFDSLASGPARQVPVCDHDRGGLRLDAAAELRARRRATATTCSGSATARRRAAARARREAAIRARSSPARRCRRAAAGTAVVLDEPAVAELPRLEDAGAAARYGRPGRSSAGRRPGTATTKLSLPRHGRYALSLQYQSQVPLELVCRRRDGRRPAALAGRHVSERRRARRLLAGGRDRRRRRRADRGHRPCRRPGRPRRRARRAAPRVAWQPRCEPGRRAADGAARTTPAATTSTTTRSSGGASG